jgi:rhamnosyltransferase
MTLALCLPTLNPGCTFRLWLEAFISQTVVVSDCLVIDSASNDLTPQLCEEAGFRVHAIRRESFDHGGTRQLGVRLCPDAEIIIFMTQDAFLATPESIYNLVAAFEDPQVGVSFGRQLPRVVAGPIEAHARFFNYPPKSCLNSLADIPSLGIKAAFISNSFAAYRRSALESVGGFPQNCLVSEDTYVAAKLVLSGWKVAYCADAKVYHSHDYGFIDEFKRYFDIGVFHAQEPWIMEKFGKAEGEGFRFFVSELKYLWPKYFYLIPSSLLRTVIKYLGFKLGKVEKLLPVLLKKRLSMYPIFGERRRC